MTRAEDVAVKKMSWDEVSRGEIVLDRDDTEAVNGTAYPSYKESNSTFKARKSFIG